MTQHHESSVLIFIRVISKYNNVVELEYLTKTGKHDHKSLNNTSL